MRHGLLCPGGGRGAEHCDQFVSLCVCLSLREHISGTAGPISTKFVVQIPCGRGQWRIQGGPGGHAPPVGGLKNLFASILILLLSRLHTMDRMGILKWLFVEGFYFPTGLCLPPFAVSVLCIACRLQQQVL